MRNAESRNSFGSVPCPTMPRGHPSGASSASEDEAVSHWRAVMRSKDSCPVRRGAVGKVPQGNSLAAYSTACPVWSGGKTARSYLSLPKPRGRMDVLLTSRAEILPLDYGSWPALEQWGRRPRADGRPQPGPGPG